MATPCPRASPPRWFSSSPGPLYCPLGLMSQIKSSLNWQQLVRLLRSRSLSVWLGVWGRAILCHPPSSSLSLSICPTAWIGSLPRQYTTSSKGIPIAHLAYTNDMLTIGYGHGLGWIKEFLKLLLSGFGPTCHHPARLSAVSTGKSSLIIDDNCTAQSASLISHTQLLCFITPIKGSQLSCSSTLFWA